MKFFSLTIFNREKHHDDATAEGFTIKETAAKIAVFLSVASENISKYHICLTEMYDDDGELNVTNQWFGENVLEIVNSN